jgi:hypothetical protein
MAAGVGGGAKGRRGALRAKDATEHRASGAQEMSCAWTIWGGGPGWKSRYASTPRNTADLARLRPQRAVCAMAAAAAAATAMAMAGALQGPRIPGCAVGEAQLRALVSAGDAPSPTASHARPGRRRWQRQPAAARRNGQAANEGAKATSPDKVSLSRLRTPAGSLAKITRASQPGVTADSTRRFNNR